MSRAGALAGVVADLVVPIIVYYVARGAGADPVAALLMSAIPPALRAVFALMHSRKVEWLPILVLVVTLASASLATISGSPRFLLAKDAAITLTLGVCVLVSVRSRRPAMFALGRTVVASTGYATENWDERWVTAPRFRRVWRTLTVIWGAGLLLDATLRATFAYALPVDLVPAVTTVQWIVLLAVLNVVSQLYLRRPAHRELVFG